MADYSSQFPHCSYDGRNKLNNANYLRVPLHKVRSQYPFRVVLLSPHTLFPTDAATLCRLHQRAM